MLALPERSITTLNHIFHSDALTLLRGLPSGYVDCAIYDFPYMGVKEDAWDNQWKTVADYIAWLHPILAETKRVLKPNGSFYGFASPQMSARVELAVQEHFNVLNNIVWVKPASRHLGTDRDTLRGYFPQTERITFAEQYGEDRYELASQRLFDEIYKIPTLCRERGLGRAEIAPLIVEDYKSLESAKAQVSNWLLGKNIPNRVDFQRLQKLIPIAGEYDDLRDKFESARLAYEPLRRTFNASTGDYTDVWSFRVVQNYPGKHPCEKPLEMLEHMLKVSTRPGAIVLDCFAGSGATLDAARRLGRNYIGCDTDAGYVAKARARLATPYMVSMFNLLPATVEEKPAREPVQKSLFIEAVS